MAKNPNPNLFKVFGHYNRKYFGGKLVCPVMIRYSKAPDPTDESISGICKRNEKGQHFILIHEKFKGHPGSLRRILVHEMVHLWGFQRGWPDRENNCGKVGTKHHRKMLRIMRYEADIC